MSLITLNGRTKRALDFSQKVLYMGIGRTTAWTDEQNPPAVTEDMTAIEELNFISKINTIKFVKPDAAGEIEYRDSRWTEILEADIYTQDVVNIYLEVLLDYDNYPLITYRQIGLLEGPTDGTDTICVNDKYLQTELTQEGLLHYIDNRTPTVRDINQKEKLSIILEF